MRRVAMIAMLMWLSGCQCGRAHERVVAAAPAMWDGGVDLELESIPERCFGDTHTLVVGPWPGCAEIELTGDGPMECHLGFADEPIRGTPIRIVRRGELLVRLKVLPRCVDRREGCVAEGRYDEGVFRTVASSDEVFTENCGDCESAIFRPGSDVVAAGTTNTDLGFATNELDDMVELILAGAQVGYTVQACAVELDALQRAHRDACVDACVRFDECHEYPVAYCRALCDDITVIESAPCLEARIAAHACLAEHGCGHRIRPELSTREEPLVCEDALVRVEYECRAS